jgi:NADPH-dependent 2,4-dienoyl-CoA reductase/sulfur reductase-like enzyme
MGGLVAAAQARARGATVELYEKGDRCGGSMLLSSGVIWRHRDFDRFRAECPGGDERLQRALFDRLDADLEWLQSVGVEPTERGTGNVATTGARFDPRDLTEALLAAVSRSRRFPTVSRSCSRQAASRPIASSSAGM